MARSTLGSIVARQAQVITEQDITIAQLQAELHAAKQAAPAQRPAAQPYVRKPYQPTAEQLAFRAAMAKAKAMAIATGHCVRVG